MTVWYFPIEAYTERYTAQLLGWTVNAFKLNELDFEVMIGPSPEDNQIKNSGPLDFTKRPWFSSMQIALFMNNAHKVKAGDSVYFDDMFTPGFEAVPYYLDRVGLSDKVGIFTRNHAGSCDVYDYVHSSKRWMRHYEMMVAKACKTVFCASSIHKELMDVQGIENVEVVGLPFDMDEVLSYHPIVPNDERAKRVFFASRWDTEKDPKFFLKVAAVAKQNPYLRDYEFAVATGKKQLGSNDPELVTLAREAQEKGVIKIYEGLTKTEYYRLVATSEIQFNCALQDFVSYTMLESSAYKTPTVAPCYRSFPEAMYGRSENLYIPGNVNDAVEKIISVDEKYDIQTAAKAHSKTLGKICTAFQNFKTSVAALGQ